MSDVSEEDMIETESMVVPIVSVLGRYSRPGYKPRPEDSFNVKLGELIEVSSVEDRNKIRNMWPEIWYHAYYRYYTEQRDKRRDEQIDILLEQKDIQMRQQIELIKDMKNWLKKQ